ncbi:mannose-1-phosphate guanylyltransferase/mannose-6-phosphate isomerase [Caenimonas aquaedulcis]|uniref:mannose-1-phosphate guanylyltransferase n=1 Tax=Caenimonas aquaedulcis TaxID=2793270 RepID=A0A931MI51_9BURK|nr:mannose-1-phosphate guanylyltransferase/mannose-6-phosphate isomerase [Caenimonas aquaedulcis]MBG9388865.1 mannose-1-phosphate guanylyltransferase/mannose-6-phosphate isomerase [Caenimonas aquaedulcis]
MSNPFQATICPVIMAGGGGTRLWPLSRSGHPKQFLAPSGGDRSLFQNSVVRLHGLAGGGWQLTPPVVITNEDYRFMVLDQLAASGAADGAIVLEPLGRNTAPALTLAALHAQGPGADPVMVVCPADHGISDVPAMTSALRVAVEQAATGSVVVLGVPASRPETGYGYIRSAPAPDGARQVLQFVEKPDLPTAERYVASGEFHWNSGIFVLKASTWLAALEAFRPDIAAATRASWDARTTDAGFVRPGKEQFAKVPSESIDYAVMEKCAGSPFDIRMVPLDAGWSDLGAWDAVWQTRPHDDAGNAFEGDAVLHTSRNTLVHATSRLVAVIGMDDAVVVETPDAVLVMKRDCSQDVKEVVAGLTARDRAEPLLPRKVHRPWGWYDSIDSGSRFQVKRIMVKPGASLSLQMHHHRAEHWIVVSGTAKVTRGDDTFLLAENESTYIPMGHKHRLSNPGKVPLEIIEVQSGGYLGEDDIVRFDDTYGRK